MNREELTAALHDIQRRRMDAFSAGNGKGLTSREHLALVPEATTPHDIDIIHEAVEELDPFGRLVVELVKDVWNDWGTHRCSVCGMTPKQAAAADYDCVREC